MTLILSILAPWGFWLCADHRLANARTGAVVDDWSNKALTVSCPDGQMLISYTGLGRIGSVDVSTWLASVIEGASRSVDQTIQYVRDEATKAFRLMGLLGASTMNHLFLIAAVRNGEVWCVEVRNVVPHVPWGTFPPLDEFVIAATRVEQPLVAIGGMRSAVVLRDRELLNRASKHRPRRSSEFAYLLALVNRRASRHPDLGSLISPGCRCYSKLTNSDQGIQQWTFEWGGLPPERPGFLQLLGPGVLMGPNFATLDLHLPLGVRLADGRAPAGSP